MHHPDERLLDEAMPAWDVHERHERLIDAPPPVVWQAMLQVTVAELPMTRVLMRARRFGRAPLGTPGHRVIDALPPGEVARREPHELLLGLVSPSSMHRPISASHELRPGTMAELRRGLPDGWVRIGMDFCLEPAGAGTRLTTETRVLSTGPRAKRAFGLYWIGIRAGSAAIRRELLGAVARRAEDSRA
jgi:hypothetical protein